MLKHLRTNEKGFTLIELLIVVAIIGILAAIAIPQFSAYRQRGYNAAANSDLRNTKTAEEAMFADRQSYGTSETGVQLTAVAGTGVTPGATLEGPVAPATATIFGGAIATMIDANGTGVRDTPVGMGIGCSSNVLLQAGTDAAWGQYEASAEHRLANRAFATTGAGPAICFAEDEGWSTVVDNTFGSDYPADATQSCVGQGSGATGAVATWVAL